MDKHLKQLATAHVETRFIKINAEKTPFFVEKLNVRVLPTLVVFADGKSIDQLIGKLSFFNLSILNTVIYIGFQELSVCLSRNNTNYCWFVICIVCSYIGWR